MSTLSTSEKAPILNHLGEPLTQAGHGAASSAPEVALPFFDGGAIWIEGVAVGTATITATRTSDGATAELQVTVSEEPFSITLGTPVPK